MDKDHLFARLSLRTMLQALNALVVISLLLVSLQAWHTNSLLEQAQVRQVALSEALRQGKQADMLHDALHADVLASLLTDQNIGPGHTQLLQQVSADARELKQAIASVAAAALPGSLVEQVMRNRSLAEQYADAAVAQVERAGIDRNRALAGMPAFNEKFGALLTALAEQETAVAEALKTAQAAAAADADAARQSLLLACMLTIVVASVMVAAITASIRRRLCFLGTVAQAIADGDLTRRVATTNRDELGDLGRAVDQMATSLNRMIETMRADARRAHFGRQLAERLDMADREKQVATVAARAMIEISPSHSMELLVSDSSRAQLERAAEHPLAGAPGCKVGSPYDCVAVRRGNVVSFEHSNALNACEHLLNRPCGNVSAVCVPVTFMGRAIGVLHAAGPVETPLQAEQGQQLATLGVQLGMRIGTVRAFEKTQLQAATDGLTGLPNRRTVEQRMRNLATDGGKPFAVVMCDLDHFKLLNDTHGHAAGDNALRTFADVLRYSLRESDTAGRWGGEEFAFILPGADAAAAVELTDRIRKRLAATLQLGKGPKFTASFGIADSAAGHHPDQLIRLADVALYQAKASGRDRACIADSSLDLDTQPVRVAETGPGIDVKTLHVEDASA